MTLRLPFFLLIFTLLFGIRMVYTAESVPSPQAIAAGTPIPLKNPRLERIIMADQETLTLTVTVSANLSGRNGRIVIPYGSQIMGQFQPAKTGGIKFVSQCITLREKPYPIKAVSPPIQRRQRIESEQEAINLIKNALLSPEAAKALTPLSGQDVTQRGVRQLADWLLSPLGVELWVIYPQRDLTLTLQTDFERLSPTCP